MSGAFDQASHTTDIVETARAIAKLRRDPEAFKSALTAFRAQDAEAFQSILKRLELWPFCHLICEWFCSKECVIHCFRLAGPPPKALSEVPKPEEFADVVAQVTGNEALLKRLVTVLDREDADGYSAIIDELKIRRFRHLLCHWLCRVRCRLVCHWLCERPNRRPELFSELREAGESIRTLAASPTALAQAISAGRANDCDGLRRVVTAVGLSQRCHHICLWLCSWRCFLVCLTLNRTLLDQQAAVNDEEIVAFAEVTARLAEQPELLARFDAAIERADTRAYLALVRQFDLVRYSIQLCHWLCALRCRHFCFCVCPPLLARIDSPTVGSCAMSTLVVACISASGPLIGIAIVGSAAGGGFDHYTLRYSWGANPPLQTAVVYPGCGRPPAVTSSNVAVLSGALGWLDVTLLPPGITAFTVYLDVFDAAAGSASASTTFEIQTRAVEITAVANVEALTAEDPFHPGTFPRLLKAVVDPSPLVPELSIGGAYSIDGSAYLVGCSRILSQYGLFYFAAPPASPAPSPADATGGTPLITAIPYEDIPGHPWQSGCFPLVTPNTIINGNLAAHWTTRNCVVPFPHTVPKVAPLPFVSIGPSGRYLIFLEARDRALPAGGFPGSFAAKDQVVVWIDNEAPTAVITSIGGISGCGDLHLKDFVGTTAAIRGIAFDPPIDPTAPQMRPNDNFGSYSLTYQKNGEPAGFAIPGATPNTRVPNVWPGPPPPGTDGLLADWDIVAALDYTGPAPTPSGRLARGERCAFVLTLSVADTTHVGDGGTNNTAGPFLYALTIINNI